MAYFVDHLLRFITTLYLPKRALDIGAGSLAQARQMAEEGIEVDAVEPRPDESVAIPEHVQVHVSSAQEFSYPLETYDLVVCRMVLQRLPEKDVRTLIDNIYLTLKKGGIFYVMVPLSTVLPKEQVERFSTEGKIEFDMPSSDFKRIRAYILRK